MFWKTRREAAIGPDPYATPAELTGVDAADLRDAYERGRKDERRARKRHPLGMTVMAAAAVVGGIVLVLAAKEGSFARGGDIVDQNLSIAADRAEPAARQAAGDAGDALKDAGRSIRDKTAAETAPKPDDKAG
jgi:hypothetical protein